MFCLCIFKINYDMRHNAISCEQPLYILTLSRTGNDVIKCITPRCDVIRLTLSFGHVVANVEGRAAQEPLESENFRASQPGLEPF